VILVIGGEWMLKLAMRIGDSDLSQIQRYSLEAKGYVVCKGNLTNLRRELHLSLAKGNPKEIYKWG
jgi:hypothetical protein